MSRLGKILAGTALTAGALLGLAWFDVLPGGWRLRTWLVPQEVRDGRQRAEHREARLARFALENPDAPAESIVFLGSSTFERFDLVASFPGKPAINRGIGDEDLALLSARLEQSLPGAPIAGLVLYAGSIDFRRYGEQPTVLAENLAELLQRLAELRPGVPVAVLGLLSEVEFPAPQILRLQRTNAALAKACEAHGASFIAADRAPVSLPDGSLDPAYTADRLHLNGAGYEHLRKWILESSGPISGLLAP
ncbi:MAG: lysophospholipase L1-like esterase [Planctomycetota bacterium]|jgi:lysophospholipase L1-like esterase